MKKVVSIFMDYDNAVNASKELVSNDIADYSIIKLSNDYEQQYRQEIFITQKEIIYTLLGALIGMVILAAAFTWLAQINNFGVFFARLLAEGVNTATFVGAGIGFALGGLLVGLYTLSKPLPKDLSGKWMFILYCSEIREKLKAIQILKKHKALIT